ncbi:MAG: ATP-binding cassette domain-containing protein [Chloroflexota bacterium]
MIKTSDLCFSYPSGVAVFDRFSWSVSAGEAWTVIGPSGCGKSTLLLLIAGLLRPDDGSLLINGMQLERPRPRTGLVLQEYGLLPWSTVWENAALGLLIRGYYGHDGKHTPADEDLTQAKSRVDHWLERLNIDHVKDRFPHQISGGQRQRTAIARTLALHPDLILMDEPFGALDALTRENMQLLMLGLYAEHHLTHVIVTHNIEEAVILGKNIMILCNPPIGSVEIMVNNDSSWGTRGYRNTSEYLDRCRYLRNEMGVNGALA